MLNFNPACHEYSDDGAIIPSVTTILKRAGYIDDRWFDEESRERGSAVHDLCERYVQGFRFDDADRELESLEYVNAFAAWMHYRTVYGLATEQIIDHEVNGHRYAGRYDLLADINDKRVLVDIKTGAKAKWHSIQLAAYALKVNPSQAMALYLRRDGRYEEEIYTGRELIEGIRMFKECF